MAVRLTPPTARSGPPTWPDAALTARIAGLLLLAGTALAEVSPASVWLLGLAAVAGAALRLWGRTYPTPAPLDRCVIWSLLLQAVPWLGGLLHPGIRSPEVVAPADTVALAGLVVLVVG